MEDVLSAPLLANRRALADRFRSATPFPHVVIDRFFDDALCRKLVEEFPRFESGNYLNENGRPGGKSTVEDVKRLGAAFCRADALFASPEFARLIGELTSIDGLLYDPAYIGGGTHENLPGQELDPHVDFNYHPVTGLHRRLNLIVYLNPEWRSEWGGSLELHQDPWLPPEQNRVDRVVPGWNRAIVFETSERSWHGFEAITPPPERPGLSRRSLALYMYTKDRPAKETAPPHSTVYVDRPLPVVLRPGESITYEQLRRIQKSLVRRRQHIDRLSKREDEFAGETARLITALLRRGEPLRKSDIDLLTNVVARENRRLRLLYDRETEFTRDIQSLNERIGGTRAEGIVVLGKGSLSGTPRGYHPDGWCGPESAFELALRENASRLALHGYVADVFAEGQSLECSVGDTVERKRFPVGAFEWCVPVKLTAGTLATMHLSATERFVPRERQSGSKDDRLLAFQLLGIEVE